MTLFPESTLATRGFKIKKGYMEAGTTRQPGAQDALGGCAAADLEGPPCLSSGASP